MSLTDPQMEFMAGKITGAPEASKINLITARSVQEGLDEWKLVLALENSH